MAKITALALADQLTGDEHLPIVQAGETKRVTMSRFRTLITPYLQNWYKGDKGDTGAANSTFATIADLRAAATANLSAILTQTGVQGVYQWTPGNFVGQVDDRQVIKSNAYALTAGAWVRQPGQGVVNVRLFGARGNRIVDDSDAIEAAIVVAVALRWPIYLPSGNYLVSRRLFPKTGVVGDGSSSTFLEVLDPSGFSDGRAILHIGYPSSTSNEPLLRVAVRGFAIRGGGIRPARRSADPATMLTNATGIFFDEMCHSITASDIDVQFCLRGLDFGGRFGHLYAKNVTLSNNWFGAWWSANTGDYCIDDNSNLGGNLFASIGLSGVTKGDGVHLGGAFGLTLRRSHGGFGPYVIWQEAGNGTIGLSGFTADDFKFENVGNCAIYLKGGTTKISGNWRLNDIGHSWVDLSLADEVASYVIQGDANHPIQRRAVVLDDVRGAPVIVQNGDSFRPGTSADAGGIAVEIGNLYSWLHDLNSLRPYKVNGDGVDRLVFTGQPSYEVQTGVGAVQLAGAGGALKELAVLQAPLAYANTRKVRVEVNLAYDNTGDATAAVFKVTTNAGEQNLGPVQYLAAGKGNIRLTGEVDLGMPNDALPTGAQFPVKLAISGALGASLTAVTTSPDGIDSLVAIRITNAKGIV